MTVGFRTLQVSEQQLRAVLEVVCRENTAFFLDRLRTGKRVQSASDAELRYCPDEAGYEVLYLDAGTLLDQGVGSCGSIAAYEAGYLRALAQHHGTPAPVAAGRFASDLLRQSSSTVDSWHAVVRTPDGHYDPCRGLQQVCVTPIYS